LRPALESADHGQAPLWDGLNQNARADGLRAQLRETRICAIAQIEGEEKRKKKTLPLFPFTIEIFYALRRISRLPCVGRGGPRNIPHDVVDTLNKAVNSANADATMTSRFADLGGVMPSKSPADFAKLIADDTAKWAKVIKSSG
jgi:hypothetical protein